MLCQLTATGKLAILSTSSPDRKRALTHAWYRSPSPAPQYDNFGRRTNTREFRYRKKLEEERHKAIEKAMKIIPSYHPPSDYRRPTKTQEKVYVPVNDYPEINFSMHSNPPLTLILAQYLFPRSVLLAIKSRANSLLLTHPLHFPRTMTNT